jgi:hypothetical protein
VRPISIKKPSVVTYIRETVGRKSAAQSGLGKKCKALSEKQVKQKSCRCGTSGTGQEFEPQNRQKKKKKKVMPSSPATHVHRHRHTIGWDTPRAQGLRKDWEESQTEVSLNI